MMGDLKVTNVRRRREKVRSELDILSEVAHGLGKIRETAQFLKDQMTLYFIDMAICQASNSICTTIGCSEASLRTSKKQVSVIA